MFGGAVKNFPLGSNERLAQSSLLEDHANHCKAFDRVGGEALFAAFLKANIRAMRVAFLVIRQIFGPGLTRIICLLKPSRKQRPS